MSTRTELTDAERHYLVGCLRSSAAENDGKPQYEPIAKASGRAIPVLRRLWLKAGQMRDPVERVNVPADIVTAAESTYWRWRWDQTQEEIRRAESDVAREKLLLAQDRIWVAYRAALGAEASTTKRTLAEMQRDAEHMAETAPAQVALALAAGLRRRGMVA